MDVLLLVRKRNASHWTTAPQSDDDGWASPITPSVPADGRRSSARPLRHVREDNSKQKKTAAVPVPLEAGSLEPARGRRKYKYPGRDRASEQAWWAKNIPE